MALPSKPSIRRPSGCFRAGFPLGFGLPPALQKNRTCGFGCFGADFALALACPRLCRVSRASGFGVLRGLPARLGFPVTLPSTPNIRLREASGRASHLPSALRRNHGLPTVPLRLPAPPALLAPSRASRLPLSFPLALRGKRQASSFGRAPRFSQPRAGNQAPQVLRGVLSMGGKPRAPACPFCVSQRRRPCALTLASACPVSRAPSAPHLSFCTRHALAVYTGKAQEVRKARETRMRQRT